ncbi:MAG: diversity-generating retroelement protein Avd [bacterium]|nr:diversity-generating retroelement protein Avd [bacterium]
MSAKKHDEPIIFVKWMEFLKWLLPQLENFPKRVRFTLANRLDNLALDLVEDLIEARYTHDKQPILRRANLRLEKLRVLLRISYEQRYLSYNSYEHATRAVNEVGRMLGGWIKQQHENTS